MMNRHCFVALCTLLGATTAQAQTLVFSSGSTTGCLSLGATLTAETAAPAGGTTFTLSASSADVRVPASVTIAEGQTTATFTVDTVAVANQTSVTVVANDGTSTASRSLTLRPLAPTSMRMSPNRIGPNSSSTGTVGLVCAAGPGDVTVTLASGDSLVTVPTSIVVPQGQQTATFIASSGTPSADTALTIRATTAGGTRSTSLTVRVPSVTTLSFTPATPVGGDTTTGSLILDFPAGDDGLVVSLSSDNGSVASPDVSEVIIPAGATSSSFGVTTNTVVNDVIVTFTATANGKDKTRTMTVRKNRIENYNISATSISVCRDVVATVKLFSAAGPGGVAVEIQNERPDLVTTSETSLTIPEGERRAEFTLAPAAPVTIIGQKVNVAVVLRRSASDVQTETETFDLVRVSQVGCL